MASFVEARSLTSLTTLASNPPLYPRDPTQPTHEALTLYIVRVPGSRDVFLTPMKPREKVVSAQDVQSSLYFLHMDGSEDQLLEESLDEIASVSEPLSSAPSQRIARKPLPTPPMSPIELGTGLQHGWGKPPQQEVKGFASVPSRKPVFSDTLQAPSHLDLPPIPPRSPRRNLIHSNRASIVLDTENIRPSMPKRPLSSTNLDYQDYQGAHAGSEKARRRDYDGPEASDRGMTPPADDAGVSLTLIRRDPTSGAQWNVAKIRDPIMQEVSSETASAEDSFKAKKGAPLYVDILNPGYTKFLDSENSLNGASDSVRDSTSVLGSESAADSEGIFRRRLWMDGSRFGDHSYSHRKSRSAEEQPYRHDVQLSPRPMIDRRSKGYSFHSPWAGKCEFSTSTAGRALKCKHIPSNARGTIADVSELRFNLPTGHSSIAAKSWAGPHESGRKRSSFLSRHAPNNSSGHSAASPPDHYFTHDPASEASTPPPLPNYFDDDGNVDLALGKERAGGGFHGKHAKLGKLIVADEGLKMLDLTVAANLALWWRAYGRV